MKKSALVAIILVLGLLVGGCSLHGGATTTSSTEASTTTLAGSTGSTSTTATTVASSTTTTETSTSVEETSTTSTTEAVPATRFEQNAAKITYAGKWTTAASSNASGGTWAYTNTRGGTVTITFEGTHLAVLAKTSPRYGKAKVALDGKTLGTIDFYSKDAKYQVKVWGSGTLKPGKHTVTLSWTGTKRTAATNTNIDIDCVVVTGTLQ